MSHDESILMFLELPASVKGQGPTMATIVEIAQVLEEAQTEPPLSLAEITRRMTAKQVRHATVRACVDFLDRLGLVTADPEGVQWTLNRDPRFQRAAKSGRRLA